MSVWLLILASFGLLVLLWIFFRLVYDAIDAINEWHDAAKREEQR